MSESEATEEMLQNKHIIYIYESLWENDSSASWWVIQ